VEEAPKVSTEKAAERSRKLLARVGSVEFWSIELPRLIDPWTPNLATSFADDAWLAPWPKVAAYGPLLAALIGLLTPWLWPWMVESYTESVIFLMLAAGGAALNWALGASLLAAYVLGDIGHVLFRSTFLTFRTMGGHAVGYLLLGVLAVRIPQLAARLASGIRLETVDSALRVRVKAALYGAVCAGLVLLWCQGTIVLIRPVFTWPGGSPTDEAIMPVQVHWQWIVAASAVAAVARVILQHRSTSQSSIVSGVPELRETPIADRTRKGSAWRGMTAWARVVLGSSVLTIILAGTYESWMDPVIVLIVSVIAGLWRNGLLGKVPPSWMELTGRIPPVIRMVIVPFAGYLFANFILNIFWSTGSLRPVMVGALVTVVLFYVFFPIRSQRSRVAIT